MGSQTCSLPAKDYGNSPRILLRVALNGFCIGIALVTCVLYVLPTTERIGLLVWLLLMPGTILTACVLPTVLFRVRIQNGRVQHLFLGKYPLSDYPLENFVGIKHPSRACAAVLHFKENRRIHFFGASVREISRLSHDLQQESSQ